MSEVEARLAALEGGDGAVLMSSGMAAVTTTLMSMVRAGQHVVFTADVYRKTRLFAKTILAKFGVESSVVEPQVRAIEAAMRDETRIVFTEAPTNPYLRVVDIEGLVRVAKSRRAKTIIDATFATPVNMRPLDLGVDLVGVGLFRMPMSESDISCSRFTPLSSSSKSECQSELWALKSPSMM